MGTGLGAVEMDGSTLWWTRSQRIRTEAELPFQAALLCTMDRPLYQRIAKEVKRLRGLGLNLSRIAAHLGTTDKTVAKALIWLPE
jgi:hypothetical protein